MDSKKVLAKAEARAQYLRKEAAPETTGPSKERALIMCYHDYSQTDSETRDQDHDPTSNASSASSEYSTRVGGHAVSVKLKPSWAGETLVELDPGAGNGAPKAYAVPGDADRAREFVEGFVRGVEDPVDRVIRLLGLASPALRRLHEEFGSRPLSANS